jgi:hypothetical protein
MTTLEGRLDGTLSAAEVKLKDKLPDWQFKVVCICKSTNFHPPFTNN